MKNKHYTRLLMLDFEFTSLDVDEAIIWDIGAVLVEFPSLNVITTYSDRCGTPEHRWNRATLEWARGTYPDRVYQGATIPPAGDRFQTRRLFLEGFMSWLESIHVHDKTIVMTNHPEMDISVLRNNLKTALPNENRRLPWHHRSVQDLQSVIWGLVNYDSAAFDYISMRPNPIDHTALSDCTAQLEWLSKAMRHRNSLTSIGYPRHSMTPGFLEFPGPTGSELPEPVTNIEAPGLTDQGRAALLAKWDEGQKRMDNIGPNGNEGEHYDA